MSEVISGKMSSAGLLGGARGSVGRSAQSPLQSLLGQNACAPGVDRENERSVRPYAGSPDWPVPTSSISSGYRSAPCYTRSTLANDATLRSIFTRCSDVQNCVSSTLPVHTRGSTTSTLLSSPLCTGHTSFTCPANPALTVRRGLNSTFSGVPVLPNIAGGVSPLWRFHSTGSTDGRRGVTAMASQSDEREKVLSNREYREAAEIQMMKEWTTRQYQNPPESEPDSSWEPMNMIMRVGYAIAMYGALVVAGNALCTFTGVDCWGGFKLDIETFGQALLWAIPPIMALLLILEDEVVKICPPARAIRDVEDEELIDFFVGMKPWQFIFVVAAGSLSEELFFRVAIQGGLAHALQYTAKGENEIIVGVSALTTIVPFFSPFAQAFAAVLTASITGSMYYIISCPKDPEYVIAPVSVNKYARNNRRDIKRRISAWYERRQLKKIYSTLMEALLALYLGFEWVQTGNIFGPMITHTLYSLVVAGNGLRRIHDNRHKLRQRVIQVMRQKEVKKSDVAAFFDKMN